MQTIMTQIKNFKFIENYSQIPWLKPFTDYIFIEICALFNIVRTAVQLWVICIELNLRIRYYIRYVVDEQNKKKWTKYRALRNANTNRSICGSNFVNLNTKRTTY